MGEWEPAESVRRAKAWTVGVLVAAASSFLVFGYLTIASAVAR